MNKQRLHMYPKSSGAAIALALVAVLVVCGRPAGAQGVQRRTSGTTPAAVIRCFVPNCSRCNGFNPYFCAQCRAGYQLDAAFTCNSCQAGYQQNLEVQTFTCTRCPVGFTSPGGVGLASQCVEITVTSGRRLFDIDEDLWG